MADDVPRRDTRATIHERRLTMDYIEWLAREANKAAAWLNERDFESEADLAGHAAVELMAVVGMLSRPFRREVPPGHWRAIQEG